MAETSNSKQFVEKSHTFENKCTKFPFEIINVVDDRNAQLFQDFEGDKTGYVQVGPKKWLLPSDYRREAHSYYNFQPRPTDTWIVSFPRSGTTVTQEMVWFLSNNLDFETARQVSIFRKFKYLEFSSIFPTELKKQLLEENSGLEERCSIIERITTPGWKLLQQTDEKRYINTHLPFQLLPPNLLKVGCKVIYIARNPKDVAVSYYHLNRLARARGYKGSFPKFWHYFMNGLLPWTPYWCHIQEGWERRNEENLLFLFYEDLVQDLKKTITKVSTFLNVDYSNDYDRLVEHLTFENFKDNRAGPLKMMKDIGMHSRNEAGFVREGKVGGWKNYFTEEMNVEADKWIEDNLRNTDNMEINFRFT